MSLKVLMLSATRGENYKLCQKLAPFAVERKAQASVHSLEEWTLPLYTPTYEQEVGVPDEAHELSRLLQEHQGLVLSCPEYNGSVPPIVVNALAWISRTSREWRSSFNGRIAQVVTHSGGGGQNVARIVKHQLQFIGMLTMPRELVVNSSRPYDDNRGREVMDQFLTTCEKVVAS